MIKADGVYVDSLNVYTILVRKVNIYNKKNGKLIKSIKVKNPSHIITDFSIDALVITTTKSDVLIFSLKTYELKFAIRMQTEIDKMLYDKVNHDLYCAFVDLCKDECKFYKINLESRGYHEISTGKLIWQQPFNVDEKSVFVFCNYITGYATNQYFINEYDKTNLTLISSSKNVTKLTNLEILDEEWCSNVWDGFENIKTGEVVLYKDIGLNEECYYITKKINDYFIVSNHKKTYLLTNDFKIIKIYTEYDFKNYIHDAAIDDEYVYLVKGTHLFLDKL